MIPPDGLEAGKGRIVVHSVGAEAVISEMASSYPLKLLSPRSTQPNVRVVYVLTYGGGLVAGDQVSLSAEARDGATLVLLTQGSTKVFKTRPMSRRARPDTMILDGTTSQNLDVVVGPRSATFLLPDPVTCFRSAKYMQTQTFRLAEDASAVILDWVSSGRASQGEDWSFSSYHSLNELWVNGERLGRDAMLLEERPNDVTSLPNRTLSDRLSPYSCYATVLMYGPLTETTRRALQADFDKITLYKQSTLPDIIWSYTPLCDRKGCILRVAAVETERVCHWLRDGLQALEEVVGKDVYRNALG